MPPATQTHVILYGMVWHMGCHWSSRSLISVIGIISINVSKHCVCDCGLIHWWIMIRICSMILRHSADCRRTWRALTEENSYMQFLHFFVNQMLYLQGRCYRGGHGAQFPNVGQFSHQMLCPPPPSQTGSRSLVCHQTREHDILKKKNGPILMPVGTSDPATGKDMKRGLRSW